MSEGTGAGSRELRPGDVVRVRSEPEILATLDSMGRLDGLPFMPEMLQHCGRTAVVFKRADKTCDTIGPGWNRRMHETVHLEGLRCGGEAHGGCQAACLTFWKETWLELLPDAAGASSGPAEATAVTIGPGEPGRPGLAARGAGGEGGLSHDELIAATRVDDRAPDGEPVYTCQATELVRASEPMRWWDGRQYARDVRSGNERAVTVVAGIVKWLFVAVQQRLTGSSVPFLRGRLTSTPKEVLDLQAGDRVRVRTKDEIERTLDTRNRNRGLSFDSEMLRYCGHEMRVLQRVERVVDERTGRMRILPNDCLILEGGFCTSEYHLFCPRSIYPFWREIWLTRVAPADQGAAAASTGRQPDGRSA